MINSSKNPTSFSGTLWFPGVRIQDTDTPTIPSKASEIARSREELLGLLGDVPESEYELSFTDLVQKAPGTVHGHAAKEDDAKTAPDGVAKIINDSVAAKERKKRSTSGNGRASSSEGVLLNLYVPAALTRSLTASSASSRSGSKGTADCIKREREANKFGCWSVIWGRGRAKWRKLGLLRAR